MRTFSNHEKNLLIYNYRKGHSVREIAKFLGKGETSVRNQIHYLGLNKMSDEDLDELKRKIDDEASSLTIADREYIERYYQEREDRQIASEIGKPEIKVCDYIRALKLKKGWTSERQVFLIENHNKMTRKELAQKLGFTIASINSQMRLLKEKGEISLEKQMPVLSGLSGEGQLFHAYMKSWIDYFKKGQVKKPTLDKYYMSYRSLKKIAPDLTMDNLTRTNLQKIISCYGVTHTKVTTGDFYTHLKACINDALHEGELSKNPCYKIVVSSEIEQSKSRKFLDVRDLKKLIGNLDLDSLGSDWIIYIAAVTGARYAEILGLTVADFDFSQNTVRINKTYDYKEGTGFMTTKTKSSERVISIDGVTAVKLQSLIRNKSKEDLVFHSGGRRFNSTDNDKLHKHCLELKIPVISFHGLRHSHGSMLLAQGVSIQSISRRLGHSKISITQDIYLHITKELENKDNELVNMNLERLLR